MDISKSFEYKKVENALKYFDGDMVYLCELEAYFIGKTGHVIFGLWKFKGVEFDISGDPDLDWFSNDESEYMDLIKDDEMIKNDDLSRGNNYYIYCFAFDGYRIKAKK